MSRTAFCLLAVLAAASLAGCSGGKAADAPEADFEDLDLAATASTGVLRGVVVDDAIRPIAGVHLTLPADGGPRTTTTSDDGLFGFEGLPPGTYFISASKPGFRPTQSSADVVAGVDEPPIVRIQLAVDSSFKAPYTEQFVFDGFIECSTGAGVVVGYIYYSACSQGVAGIQPFPNDHFAESVVLSSHPLLVQSEMSWESTQAVSKSLSHSFHYPDPGETDGQKDLSVFGPSPLINSMNESVAKEYVEGLDYAEGQNLTLNQRIFTVSDNGDFGPGPALTVEQTFTVYSTVFYGYLPPEGWTFMDTGEIPPPPQ